MAEYGFFKLLTEDQQGYLKKNLMIKTYAKGEIIFTPEDECNQLCIVLEGELRLLKYPSDNQEYILEILNAGDVFGEAILFDHTPYPVYVSCARNTSVGILTRDKVLYLMRENPDFMEFYLTVLCRKIKNLNKKIDLLTKTNIKGRIVLYLKELQKEQKSNVVSLDMTKQTLALLLGTSREVLSRNFSELEKEGLIKQKKDQVEIFDIDQIL